MPVRRIHNWPPATESAYIADIHDKVRPIAAPLKGLGINAIRIDLQFADAYEYSAGDLNPHFEFAEEALTQIVAAGYDEVFCVIEPVVHQTTYWKSFNGGNAFTHAKRMPAAVLAQLKVFEAEFINHCYLFWISIGGHPDKFHVVPANECYVGGAGFGTAQPKAFLEGLGYEGYWDTSVNWSTTWAAALTGAGYGAHTTNLGIHDCFEILIPYLFANTDSRINYWMPAHGMENFTNEALTYQPAGFTWHTLSRWYDADGRKRCTFNEYRGVDDVWLLESTHGAAYRLMETLDIARAEIEAYHVAQDDGPILLLNTETGTIINWLDQHYGRKVGYAQLGRIMLRFMRLMKSLGKQYGLFTICLMEALSEDAFSLVALDGTPHLGTRILMEACGITGATSPNGIAYEASANEPSTPAQHSSETGTD